MGLHSVQMEGDILFFQWVGDFAPEEITKLHTYMEGMLREHDFIFLLVDATRARLMSPEARRLAASWPDLHRLGGAAIVGASLTTRALVTITLAIRNRIVAKEKAIPAVKLVNTEEAARAFIDARRRQILATGGGRSRA